MISQRCFFLYFLPGSEWGSENFGEEKDREHKIKWNEVSLE